MRKKIIALITALLILTATPFTATATTLAEKRLWTDGGEYSLELSGDLKIKGEKKLEFTLPFYSDSVTVKTKTPGTVISFEIDGVKNEITLKSATTEFEFPEVLRLGEKDLTISGDVTITDIIFNEITEEKSATMIETELTDYEEALKTALVIREGCPILKSRLATRYYDYDNINVKPEYFDGSLYVPADALALALEIYWEQDKENDFFVLRKNEKEIIWVNGEMKYGENNVYSPYNLTVKEFYGKTYVPLRQIADVFGNYVLYKNGFVIIDYRSRANTIANKFFKDLQNEFIPYMPDETAGNTYYVSKNANASDENDGSKDKPWATIEKANQTAKEGDTVIIGEGTWHESIKPENDGTASSPITFKAEEGKDVYLSATQTINKFTEYRDGILVASVPNSLEVGRNQVFYKNKNLIEARYPNSDVGEDGLFEYSSGIRLDPEWLTEGDLKVSKEDQYKVTSDTLLQEEDEDHWKGAYFISMHSYAWSYCLAKVESSKKGELTVTDTSALWWWPGTDGINKGYLTCHINCIDQPGEWTIEDDMLYIMPPEGETAETLELEVKNKQLVFDLSDRSYIHIDGFKTFGGSGRLMDSKMCVINNCDMQYISHYTYLDYNAGLKEDNTSSKNGILQRGEVGVYLGGENNAVVNTKIQHSAGCGVAVYGTYHYIDNNLILDTDYMGASSGAGIAVGVESWKTMTDVKGGHTITHNTVKRTSRSSITFGGNSKTASYQVAQLMPMEVAYNECVDDSLSSLDTGTIYTHGANLGHNMLKSRLHNNFTYETYTSGPTVHAGFYYDNWSNGSETFDNVQFAAQRGQFMYETPVEQTKRVFPMSYATVDAWNNNDLGQKTKDQITINDFPGTKPFQVGSTLEDDSHNFTYEYYKNNCKAEGIYTLEDMQLSDGVQVVDSKAKFTAKDQWIKLENVDFDKFNRINVTYTSDYYTTNDDFLEVIVGEDINNPKDSKKIQLLPDAKYKNEYNNGHVKFDGVGGGVQTVWVRPLNTFGNSEILQFTMSNEQYTLGEFEYDHTNIECGMFTDCGKGDDPKAEGKPIASPGSTRTTSYLWGGNWTEYKGVKLGYSVDTFTIDTSTADKYSGIKITLRMNSPDGPVLAEITAEDSGWAWKENKVKLNQSLAAGTYDLYLVGEGSGKNASIGSFSLE